MTTITIPKQTSEFNSKLVAVPESLYGEFLKWQKKTKSSETFTASAADKSALLRARKNFKSGNYSRFK